MQSSGVVEANDVMVNIAAGGLRWIGVTALPQAALPLFIARDGGNIVVTSSVTGPRVAYPGLTHYAASKAGVNGFIRNAAHWSWRRTPSASTAWNRA